MEILNFMAGVLFVGACFIVAAPIIMDVKNDLEVQREKRKKTSHTEYDKSEEERICREVKRRS